jgi:hypothetical protein
VVRARWGTGVAAGVVLLTAATSAPVRVSPTPAFDVVATGVPRPLQLAVDGATLVVLAPAGVGNGAGELYRVDLSGELPVDLARQPRILIPFVDSHLAALGSLGVRPSGRELFLGEENGTRIYRLDDHGRLTLYATGLHWLAGGGTLVFDREGHLVILDYVDPRLSSAEERVPPGLEQFRDEDYRGPLVLRLALDATIPLPRRLERLAPLFPKAWGGKQGGALLPRLLSVAPLPGGGLVFLSSGGGLFRLGPDGVLVEYASLPPGQYNRTTMAGAPDGAVYVSGGFHMAAVFRVEPDGAVTTIAQNLADPEGIALDARGDLYVAESSFHRILRVKRPAGAGGPVGYAPSTMAAVSPCT